MTSRIVEIADKRGEFVLKLHPLVCEYKTDSDNFTEWVKVNE